MKHTELETIRDESLENVVGGEGAGWLGILSGGKLNLASMLGGSSNLLGTNKDGTGKGLAEGISSLFTGGGGGFQPVEGKDPTGFGG